MTDKKHTEEPLDGYKANIITMLMDHFRARDEKSEMFEDALREPEGRFIVSKSEADDEK